jgi:hypothetical protein
MPKYSYIGTRIAGEAESRTAGQKEISSQSFSQ